MVELNHCAEKETKLNVKNRKACMKREVRQVVEFI